MKLQADRKKVWNYLNYVPNRHQESFHDSKAKFKLIIGEERTGKTHMVFMDIMTKLIGNPIHNRLVWNCGFNWDNLRKDWAVWNGLVVDYMLNLGMTYKYCYSDQMRLAMHNNDSYETKNLGCPETILGKCPSFIIINDFENVTEDLWNMYILPKTVCMDADVYMIVEDTKHKVPRWFKKKLGKYNEKLEIFMSEIFDVGKIL